MKVSVKYFASIREAFACSSEIVDTDVATLSRGRLVRMALNQVMSDESAALAEGCEVAFFPPVTGG
jgi:molybdopterin synthase sulfur carrier subunit